MGILLFLACALSTHGLVASNSNRVVEQVHIAHGHSPSQMTVVWLSNTSESGVVIYSTNKSEIADNKMQEDDGSPERYNFTNANSVNWTYTSAWIHTVNLDSLNAKTTYYYKAGAIELDPKLLSPMYSFVTPPDVDMEAPYLFAVIGDLGQTNNSEANVRQIKQSSPGTTMLIGDLSYADASWTARIDPKTNQSEGECNATRWDSWGRMIEPLAAFSPLMTLPGNHEVEAPDGPGGTAQTFRAYRKRMRMPTPPSKNGHGGTLYYSVDIASVHWVMLNSYEAFNATSLQYQWLINDLGQIDPTMTPWTVVSMHAPWYNSNVKHHNEPEEVGMREALEGVLEFAHVDLVFAGHVHAYERMHNVFNNKTDISGPVYINIGDAGNREGHCPDYYPQPSWSAYREDQYGHGMLEVLNSTHMKWDWHRLNATLKTETGDTIYVVKKAFVNIPGPGAVAVGRSPASTQGFDGYAHLKPEATKH